MNELRTLRHKQGRVFRTQCGRPLCGEESGGGPDQDRIPGRVPAGRNRPISARTIAGTPGRHGTTRRTATLIALMKLGGWKSERMVLRYAHVNVSQLAPSINAGLAAWSTKSAPSTRQRQKLRRVK